MASRSDYQLLTNCAACAAPLALNAPRCIRCRTRYCDATCQQDHWRRGHKQICKKIHRGGNAEQYYADKKYKEAVAEAVEKCAGDTKGRTCYICMKAEHSITGEGLVRGCACRGTAVLKAGFAHLSCLAESAKILVTEAVRKNLDDEECQKRWDTWHACSLCKQHYQGVVRCALGWACWKTYCDEDVIEFGDMALNVLAVGLLKGQRWEEGLHVNTVQLARLHTELPESREACLEVMDGQRQCYEKLGRTDAAIALLREIYDEYRQLEGRSDPRTLVAAGNFAGQLMKHRYLHKAKAFLGVLLVEEESNKHSIMFHLKRMYAITLWNFHYYGYDDYRDDLRKAVEILEDLVDDSVRVRGADHEITESVRGNLRDARDEQLDWCIDDLTPATFHACGPGLLLESSTDSEDADAATAS